MLRAAICDDCPQQTKVILALIEKYKTVTHGIDISLHTFSTGEALLKALDDGSFFDLFLLDILMPGLNGIELALELRERIGNVPLVFLTSASNYALDAFSVSAMQYLLKPVREDSLFPVLDKIISFHIRDEEPFFVLNTSGSIAKIPFSAIVSAELSARTLKLNLKNGEALFSKTLRAAFDETIAPLLEDERFLHAHKSFVLNLSCVQELTSNSFHMNNGIQIPIPRKNYSSAKTRYLEFCAQHGNTQRGSR